MKRISFTAVALLIFSTLFCSILEVGDTYSFLNISDALRVAQSGDIIRVHDGIYQEALTIDKSVTILSDFYYDSDPSHIEDTVINNTTEDQAILFDTNDLDVNVFIAGFSVTGKNSAIKIGQNSGIDAKIYYCNLYAQATSGAEVVSAKYSTSLDIRNTRIIGADGFGINANGADVTIQKCEITGISSSAVWFNGQDVASLVVKKTVLANNGSGIDLRLSEEPVVLDHCTIANNSTGIRLFSGDLTVNNSIIYGNNTQIHHVDGNYTVTYSDVQDGCSGEGNINANPLFDPDGNGTFDLRWNADGKSPCIDAGDWSTTADQDGTPPDMGAYPAVSHRYDVWGFPRKDQNNGWRWFCVPAVDNVLTNPALNSADALFGGMIEANILDHVSWSTSDTEGNISLLNNEWTNLDHVVSPVQGYKIKMNENAALNYYIEVAGFNPAFDTVIPLSANEDNWVGYFLPETRLAIDLFDSIKDNIKYIKAQRWALSRVNGDWIGDKDVSLDYGDMVIISVNQSCNFQWDTSAQITEPENYPFPEFFTYEEKAEYIPFFVEYTPEFQNEEIAVVIDGEVKGASVVFGSITQINGYLDDDEDGYEGGSHMGEVDFIIWCPPVRGTKAVNDYYVYDESLSRVVPGKVNMDLNRDYYYVSFDKESVIDAPPAMDLSHYPNPFNPETTIRYTIDHQDHVTVDVYNVKGQKVRSLVSGTQSEGYHQVTWRGNDENGKPVSSGIYFCRLKSGNQTMIRKMMLMK